MATLNAEVGPKRLELMHQVIPAASNVALLINPTNPAISEPLSRDAQAAVRTLGMRFTFSVRVMTGRSRRLLRLCTDCKLAAL